jgi:hypothetical protein
MTGDTGQTLTDQTFLVTGRTPKSETLLLTPKPETLVTLKPETLSLVKPRNLRPSYSVPTRRDFEKVSACLPAAACVGGLALFQPEL